MKKICIITGTRAEYGLFYPIMREINKSHELELQLIVTTMHLSKQHRETYKCIEEDGFKINAKINNLIVGDSNVKSYARLMFDLPEHLNRLKPDVVLLLGDRFETHAAAATCLLMNIPIAHIHGGEITQGAVDEQLRHSISKMAHLHFTSTEAYRDRLIQMGEQPENVIVSGAPGIDNILSLKLKPIHQLEQELNWRFGQKSALFTYHSETLSEIPVQQQIDEILEILENTNLNILFTGANADTGGDIINQQIKTFVNSDKKRYLFVHNLGMLNYYSAMENVDVIIGNSSSGIIEAASFKKPVVDIGNRQKGRLTSGNVINCSINVLKQASVDALNYKTIYNNKLSINRYGDGKASIKIINELINSNIKIIKQFNNQKKVLNN